MSEQLETRLPTVVSVTDQSGEARYPSFKVIMAAKKKPVQSWDPSDLDSKATSALSTSRAHGPGRLLHGSTDCHPPFGLRRAVPGRLHRTVPPFSSARYAGPVLRWSVAGVSTRSVPTAWAPVAHRRPTRRVPLSPEGTGIECEPEKA